MYRFSKLLHLFFYALLVGFMAVTQWSAIPGQDKLSASAYTVMEQGANSVLMTLTPVLMILGLLGGLAATFLAFRQHSRLRLFYLGGVLCLIVMIVSTLLINAPVNAAVETWNAAAPPANWQDMRERWQLGHAIRSYVGLAGLMLSMIAVIWESDTGEHVNRTL